MTYTPEPTGASDSETHGQRIAPFVQDIQMRLQLKKDNGQPIKLSKAERAAFLSRLNHLEKDEVIHGVNFSRTQIESILRAATAGQPLEFETLGPYLSAYAHNGGRMTADNLLPEDAIGLALARTFHRLLPAARLVSLCDEYNGALWSVDAAVRDDRKPSFKKEAKQVFMQSLVELFKQSGAIEPQAVAGKDYLILPESAKVRQAPRLVQVLSERGYVKTGEGQELLFVNDAVENPLHRQFHLRTKTGRWLCEALDASSFLKEENKHITHIVVLPNYMREQQDRVWEILRVLHITPSRYHNIFYDKTLPAAEIQQTIERAFYVVWSSLGPAG